MASLEHLALIKQGVSAWNAWRRAQPEAVPDLSELRLSLAERQLGPTSIGAIDLNAADLTKAVLDNATLTEANLQAAILVNVDLSYARLTNADLRHADLSGAILFQADLANANLDGALLNGALLGSTRNLTQDQLDRALGDAETTLPASLHHPIHWQRSSTQSQSAPKPRPRGTRRDHYRVLGLKDTASSDDIRSAFHKLARMYHPDLHPGDRLAETQFKRVNAAYQILKDTEKRALYDRYRTQRERRSMAAAMVMFGLVSASSALIGTAAWMTIYRQDDGQAAGTHDGVLAAAPEEAKPIPLLSGVAQAASRPGGDRVAERIFEWSDRDEAFAKPADDHAVVPKSPIQLTALDPPAAAMEHYGLTGGQTPETSALPADSRGSQAARILAPDLGAPEPSPNASEKPATQATVTSRTSEAPDVIAPAEAPAVRRPSPNPRTTTDKRTSLVTLPAGIVHRPAPPQPSTVAAGSKVAGNVLPGDRFLDPGGTAR